MAGFDNTMKNPRRPPAARLRRLDGLRGIAVITVVVYHAWPRLLPGGWIGVSLFFVLSGYLITGQLARAQALHDLGDFWRRRARRLLPATFATLAGTLSLVWLREPTAMTKTAEESIAALLYVHNWWSMHTTGGYWEIFDTTPRPLAHLWSLSIEEQAYLLWPPAVVMLGLKRAVGLGAIIAAFGAWWWWGSPDAYYATPVRFAEILGGAGLVLAGRYRLASRITAPLGAIAAVLLSVLMLTLSESSRWVPAGGLLAIVATSTILVGYLTRPTTTVEVLDHPVLVWFGLRSYGIYLLHWPLLVLLDVPPPITIVLALALAEVSYRFVEMPIRDGRRIAHPLRSLGLASVACILGIGILLLTSAATKIDIEAATAQQLANALPPTTVQARSDDRSPTEQLVTSTTLDAPTTETPTIKVKANPTTIVVGDSTGHAIEPAIRGWIEAHEGVLLPGARVSCGPLFDADHFADWSGISYISGEFGPLDKPCRPSIETDVDLILIVDHGVAMMDHRDLVRDKVTNITEPLMNRLVTEYYDALAADADAAEAIVVILTAPQSLWPVDGTDDFHPARDRLDAYHLIVSELASHNPHVFVLDVGPTIEAKPERYPRSDTIHLDGDSGAINLVVDLLSPAIEFATTGS